jgi:hypothetical protein
MSALPKLPGGYGAVVHKVTVSVASSTRSAAPAADAARRGRALKLILGA